LISGLPRYQHDARINGHSRIPFALHQPVSIYVYQAGTPIYFYVNGFIFIGGQFDSNNLLRIFAVDAIATNVRDTDFADMLMRVFVLQPSNHNPSDNFTAKLPTTNFPNTNTSSCLAMPSLARAAGTAPPAPARASSPCPPRSSSPHRCPSAAAISPDCPLD
jgi:hypothetical protein